MRIRKIASKALAVLISSVMAIPAFADKNDKVTLLEPPVKVSEISGIDGFIGDRMKLNRDVYLKNFPIDKYVDFVVKHQHKGWNWTQAEQHGKWIESAYLSAIQSKDKELYKKAKKELYRITGDKSLLRKVEGAWNDIAKRQMYITGGVSVAEHYEHDFVKPLSGNIVESCATMSWMQLSQMLLQLTGDTQYADAMERLMINHVFAAQDALEGTCRYHTAPNGEKPAGYFHGPDCCTASE